MFGVLFSLIALIFGSMSEMAFHEKTDLRPIFMWAIA
jgi:hypothetical protein